ncbi:response regulator receiver modulated metal dependent phosphohydrolase [Oxalobacteraceae bacterium IMCC9480]|nr:response regulator receiver modulated metal dependent phosphohydrolase [Oxalobacteraceae bacterium IMCC9480]NDP60550.1 response regulator [Oxalobacteraceae bacterium]
MNVLIVDDNEMTRTVLRAMLFGTVHHVCGEAGNGKAGLELALKLLPDIVFLDILMPDLSGIEVLKQLKEAMPHVVVLMVTGERDTDTIRQCVAAGASGFIIKPFNAATVLKALADAALRAGGAGHKPAH